MFSKVREVNICQKSVPCEKVFSAEKSWMDIQRHDYFEISLIVEGCGTHLVLDQAIPCQEGDLFVTPPDIPHGYFLEDEQEKFTVRQIRFYLDELSENECYGMFKDGSVCAYAMLNRSMRDKIDRLFSEIEQEIKEKNSLWQEIVESNLSLLLINVARYIDSSIKNKSSVSTGEWNVGLSAIQIIKNNFSNPKLTLGQIAEMLYISKPYMSRIFQKLTGKHFNEYLRSVRMEYACKQLTESDLNVEEIVLKCGLKDIPSFYKNFNLYMGMTPNEYRQEKKQSVKKIEINKVSKGERVMVVLSEISENLQKGKSKIVKEMVQQAIDEGANVEQILNEGLLSGMNVVGEKFKNNEIYVPEVLVAARAMNMGVQVLKPYLMASGVKATGKVCIGTVQGDLHDIGKNIVKMMMEGKGLEVVDLGTDVAPETFVQTAIDENCQVICCSALLTTTMGVMADVVKKAEKSGIRDKVKIMIGGAPINQEYCDSIGADCYTVDAASAADAAVEFCK